MTYKIYFKKATGKIPDFLKDFDYIFTPKIIPQS